MAGGPMAYSHYEVLSALDTSFLTLESADVHMHVASVGIFEGGPLVREDGSLDMDRVRAEAEPALRTSARFRQRVVPGALPGQFVWVDDPHFRLDYHVRHTSLPLPGSVRQLKRLTGRILSQKLDRAKPLWEMWFVEGLEDGRFAVISKIHHAVIDGVSGVELMAAFMALSPDAKRRKPTGEWMPRPAPSSLKLGLDEVGRRASLPWQALSAGARALAHPVEAWSDASETLRGVADAFEPASESASPSPLNVPIGPHRRFDWTTTAIEDVKRVRASFGGTLNDVALATLTGSLRSYLVKRGCDVDDMTFRAMLPVNVRARSERGKLGNRVAMLICALPIDEPDPVQRLRRVTRTTRELKGGRQVQGAVLLERLGDWTHPALVSTLSRLGPSRRAFNLVVTNVPGPRKPAYLLGSRMVESYPVVPLFEQQALGVALFSYAERLEWGFNACWDALPDLHDVVEGVQSEFDHLCALSEGGA